MPTVHEKAMSAIWKTLDQILLVFSANCRNEQDYCAGTAHSECAHKVCLYFFLSPLSCAAASD